MRLFDHLRAASAACLALAILSTGCVPDERSFGRDSHVLLEGQGGGRDSESSLGDDDSSKFDFDPDREDEPPMLLAAFDDGGALVLVDTAGAGAVVARRAIGDGIDPIDLVVDPYRPRIVVVVKSPPFEESEIVEIPLDGSGERELGAPRALGRVTGDARVMPITGGIVVASNEDGPRVRLMRDDGERTHGRALPEPLSWWADPRAARIEGLASDADGALVRFGLEVDAEGSIAVTDHVMLEIRSDDARLAPGVIVHGGGEGDEGDRVRTSPGDLVVHDRTDGSLAVARGDGTTRSLAWRALGLEGAVAWSGEIALTTTEPPALVLVGDTREDVVPVPEGIRSGSPFGRHDLVVVAGSLFVATSASVIAIRPRGRDGSASDRDVTFVGAALRGPLARVAD